MDSSQSQHSHPSASASDSKPMSMSLSNAGSNSIKASSPSAGNHPPELLPQGDHESESSGSLKTNTSTDFEPEEENNFFEMLMNEIASGEEELAAGKESVKVNEIDTATASTSHGGGNPRGAEELGLLTDLYAFYNKFQHYQFTSDIQDFYNTQVYVYRNYETYDDVDEKMCELYDNYINVVENKVEFPTDPVDIKIIRHSSWVCGFEKFPNDNHNLQDSEDSSEHETGDDEMIKDSNDSHKQETDQDDGHGTIRDQNDSSKEAITGDDDLKLKDPESLIEQETEDVDMKDSKGWKDSSGNEGGGPSAS